jgi:dissimilatory sulfite reductase (desulfoviridin) alpha/beta subunit
VGRWAGQLGPAGRSRLGEWAGRLGWKKKKKEIHSKLISRFSKMNKEIQVTEIIEKNLKNSHEILENLGRQECELE